MKTILIFLIFTVTSAFPSVQPLKGLYDCKNGNEESICDQIVKPFYVGYELTAISVEYVGWCGSMGPYLYACENEVCEDPGLKFKFKSSTKYHWENKQYGFRCDFEKKNKS